MRVICDRAENVKESYDFMLGRSVSAVPTFLGFSSHFINPHSLVSTSRVSTNSRVSTSRVSTSSRVSTTTDNDDNHTHPAIEIGSGLLYIKGDNNVRSINPNPSLQQAA